MAAWPGSLPSNINVDGAAEQAVNGVLRTQMDAGPDFTRRRYSATPNNISGSLVLSDTDIATLDAFYQTTLNGGSDAFDWTHPRTGASVSMRFLSPPAYRPFSNDLWQAALALEILP